MDDPIFDPWSLPEEESPPPPPRRWRTHRPREVEASTEPVVQVPVTVEEPVLEPPAAPSSPAFREEDEATRLQRLVGDRAAVVAQTLAAHRHGVTVDERFTEDPPSLRLRLEPVRSPLDSGPRLRDGSVLEVRIEAERISCRFWMDAMSTEPDTEVSVEPARATSEWMDRVLLHFVDRTLRAV